MKNRLLHLLILFAVSAMAMAQKDLTLEELNPGGQNYWSMVPERHNYQWWGDQVMRIQKEKVSLVDKKTAKEKPLFTLDEVKEWISKDNVSFEFDTFRDIVFPSATESVAVIENGQSRVIFDWKKHKVIYSQIVDAADEAYILEWNPASKVSAVLRYDNLFLRDADGKEMQLTTDGSREIVYGQAVHRNEFAIMKGTFFAPDGQKMAFYRMDQSMVSDYPQVNIDPRVATHEPDKYPMAGETSHKVTIAIADCKTGKVTWLDLGDTTDRYFSNLQWSPDGKMLCVVELNRDQTDQHLDAYDAVTGKKIKTLYTEHNDKYTEPLHAITLLPWDESKFILWSEKDGFWHLYLMDTDGNMLRQLTKGEWVVMDLLGFNTEKKQAYIVTREKSAIQQNVYLLDINTGRRTLLDNGEGVHSASVSASGKYLLDSYSSPVMPRQHNVIAVGASTAKTTTLFTANDPWVGYKQPIIESGSIKAADGVTDLYYRMVKPYDFDPSKKYPAIVYVYGGPHARNVEASWHYLTRGWEPYMANKGYIIYILDNRGSCDRGRDFEQVTFRHLGQEEMKDQMEGVRFLKSLPYVDSEKLGVHGWSYGGFMTTSLMTNYPDVFKVGVAGGPVIDWKWYEVMYGERYMDTPQQNPEGYEQTSLINKAKDLKGKLLIITGYNDNTVVPQHCISFLKACIDAGTQPDFFMYPGEQHNMRGRRSVHLHEKITQYFLDYLK